MASLPKGSPAKRSPLYMNNINRHSKFNQQFGQQRACHFINIVKQRRQMGTSPYQNRQTIQSPNDHFLSLTICPENDKMHAEVFVPSSVALNRWASDLIKVAQTQPQNILIPKQYKVVGRATCGEGVTLQIQFQCFYIPLSYEIDKRKQCEKYLQESEMWYLLFCLVQSAAACEQLGERVGDINPKNILLSKTGKLKIISKLSVPNYCDPLLLNHRQNLYLSPQQLQAIKKGFKDFPLNFILSESFSIGMAVLSAGTLEDLQSCYDYNNSELNRVEFNKMITFWQQNEFYSQFLKRKTRYSHKLKSFVLGLLELNPEKRQSSLQIYNVLKPHVVSIMKMQAFDFQSRKLSPINKLDSLRKKQKFQTIHILRSRKKNESRLSPAKAQEHSKTSPLSPEIGLEFSFRSPESNPSPVTKNIGGSLSLPQKLKLANSFNILNNISDSK